MSLPYRKTLVAVLGPTFLLGAMLVDGRPAAGGNFRVENQVFFGSGKKADSTTTTIFHEGVVYDYLQNPPEVIVLDTAGSRFVLLDVAHRTRAELRTDDVAAFTRRLQQAAGTHSDPFIKFQASPKFAEKFDESSRELTLSSPWMTYRLMLLNVENPGIVAQYRDFADWYARLNTMLNPGSRPPTARLLVNAALQQRNAIAREVHLTLIPKKTFPPTRVTVRSQHQLIREIAEADLDRVAQTRQFMDIFKPVSFEQYRSSSEH